VKICPACSREWGDEHAKCADDGVPLVHLDSTGYDRAQDLIGQIVDGRYRLERIVGKGGMGTVYACRHVVVGKSFAMKVLRPGIERSEEVLQRFIREAQAANQVQSRHICEMTDFGQLPNGAFYVVMDLLQGWSLTRGLREKRLGRRELKHVFIQVAETLDKAHRCGIIHRDLKPDNVVLVEDDGDPFFVKLVDFGIAKMLQSKASDLTETGVILGTPYYMSPEQARGDPLDHRSDVYACGVMMYRAFTGRLPFVADTAMGVLTRHLTEKPELPSRITEIDPALERLILRCLEKKPIDRYQSMADLAEALRTVDDVAQRARPLDATIDERSSASVSRRPTPTSLQTPSAKSGEGPGSVRHSSRPPPAQSFPPPLPAPMPPSAPTWVPPGRTPRPGVGAQAVAVVAAPQPHVAVATPSPYAAPHATPLPHSGMTPAPQVMSTSISSGSHPPPLYTPVSGAHPQHAYTPASGAHPPQAYTPISGGYAPSPALQSAMSSGAHGAPPALHGPYPDPLQGEAHTNRGLVSSRISVRPRPGGQHLALIGAAAAIIVCVGAVVAVALVGHDDAPPAAQPASGGERRATPAPTVEPTPTAVTDEAPPPEPESSASAQSSASPRSTAAPKTSGSRPAAPTAEQAGPPPPPAPEPEVDDVRDPFK
jgi:eukaryotic-like serine/threonine-protein kinase